jgi:sugar fermentation stimulation protein A
MKLRFMDHLQVYPMKGVQGLLALQKTAGIYHLILYLKRRQRLCVGALGLVDFPSGYYIYTGSAQQGLAKRLERHLRKGKTRHWHIDYLTAVARIEQILVDGSGTKTECQRHELIMNLTGAKVIIPGFGSSDCHCPSHVAYFEKRLPPILCKLSWKCRRLPSAHQGSIKIREGFGSHRGQSLS